MKHTLLDCWNSLLEDNVHGNKESTLKDYRDRLLTVLIPSFKDLKEQGYNNFEYVEDFSFADYKIWYRHMKQRKKIRGEGYYLSLTLRTFYSTLSRLFEEAFENGWIEKNIVSLSHNFVLRKDIYAERKIKYQTLDDFELFLSVVDDQFWYTLFLFWFWHGLRIGELLALQYEDLDLENWTIHIHKTASYQGLDGTYLRIVSATKNYKHRIIKININCREQFIKYINNSLENEEYNLKKFIFNSKRKGILHTTTVRNKIISYYKKAEKKGINIKYMKPHELFRHSLAAYMKNYGATPRLIAFYLGDTEDTIKRVYFHDYELELDNEADDFFTNLQKFKCM
jgi:integrase